jgi:hypothetical protein
MTRRDPEVSVLAAAFLVSFVGLLLASIAWTHLGALAVLYAIAGALVMMWPVGFLFVLLVKSSARVERWWERR